MAPFRFWAMIDPPLVLLMSPKPSASMWTTVVLALAEPAPAS
jgi:hypothetical protein